MFLYIMILVLPASLMTPKSLKWQNRLLVNAFQNDPYEYFLIRHLYG